MDRHAVAGPARAYRHEGRRAFRSVQIRRERPEAALRVHRLAMTLVHYPVVACGAFDTSDPAINRIWELKLHHPALHAAVLRGRDQS
jgi:hypothetical protein